MKQRSNKTLVAAAALLAAGLAGLQAQTVLTNQHTDIGLAYEQGTWDLHVHNETDAIEYSPPTGPNGAILQVGTPAQTTVPADPRYSFLGSPGSSVWILPKTQNPELLFLGFGAEELIPAEWNGNITVSLTGVTGPGNFTAWDTDAFGAPNLFMNSADGISGADAISVIPGSHLHVNWGFSAPGDYTVFFEASGNNVADGVVNSGPVAYEFSVVPEPGTWALLGLGGVGLLLSARRRSVRR